MAIITNGVRVLVNGSEMVATYNSSTGYYEVSATAPSQTSGSNNSGSGPGVGAAAQGKGYYPVTVTVTDDAGNVTSVDDTDSDFGSVLRLSVLETDLPTAAITYPSAGGTITNARPTITFTVTDAGSGVRKCYIKVDGGSAVEVTPSISGSVASCTFTPVSNLSDGNHTIVVYGTDYDGNTSAEVSSTFKIDTTPPTLNISAPADNIKTNVSTVSVTGTTNDANSTPVTVVITVGSQTYTPTVAVNGSFTQVVDLTEGTNVITIKATDSAGLESTVTRTVSLDTAAPVITEIIITDNPTTTGTSYTIQIKVTD